MPRNLRFMRVRVWLDPNEPMIANYMLRQDDGVMVWIELNSGTKRYINFVEDVVLLDTLLLIVHI